MSIVRELFIYTQIKKNILRVHIVSDVFIIQILCETFIYFRVFDNLENLFEYTRESINVIIIILIILIEIFIYNGLTSIVNLYIFFLYIKIYQSFITITRCAQLTYANTYIKCTRIIFENIIRKYQRKSIFQKST